MQSMKIWLSTLIQQKILKKKETVQENVIKLHEENNL